jgi:hypothetical protein
MADFPNVGEMNPLARVTKNICFTFSAMREMAVESKNGGTVEGGIEGD